MREQIKKGFLAIAVLLFTSLMPVLVLASSDVWNGANSTNMADGNNYVTPGVPSSGDSFTFNAINGQVSNVLSSNFVAGFHVSGITFSGAALGYTVGNSGNNAIVLTGDIVNNSSSANPEAIGVPISLSGSHNISNNAANASSTVTITGGVSSASGALTLTNNGTGNAGVVINGGLVNGAGTLSVVQNSSTSGLEIGGANTYSGGATIKMGGLQADTASALGSGTLTLGDSSANVHTAGLFIAGSNLTFNNPIALGAGTSATLTLQDNGGNTVFTGGVTGNNSLTINEATANGITFSTSSVNNIGNITNVGAGAGATTISGGIGANVATITENASASNKSALNITGGIITRTGISTTLIDYTGALTVSGADVTGSGAFILENATGVADSITVSSNVNNSNLVLNAGSSGETLISGAIGSNVTEIEENGPSALSITGGITTNVGGTTLLDNSGTLTVSGTGITGSGGLILQNDTGVLDSLTISSSINNSNASTIINNGTSGETLLSGGIGSNVTNIEQFSAGSALKISTGAITVNTLYGTTLGDVLGTFNVTSAVTGTGDLDLYNDSSTSNGLTLSGNINNLGAINYSGNNSATISGQIGALVTNISNFGGSVLTLSGNNSSFLGPINILDGEISALNPNSLGNQSTPGTIYLGDSNTSNAYMDILQVQNAGTYANPIVLGSDTSNTLYLENTGNAVVFSGGITGDNSFIIDQAGAGGLTISALVNNAGTITNIGGASGTATLASVGSNVTALTENSATSALSIGDIALNSTATTLTDTVGSLTVTGNVTGTGNLRLNNNSATNGGITVADVSFSGLSQSLVNSGTGTGSTNITALSAEATYVVEDSTTSALNITGSMNVGFPGIALTNALGTKALTVSGSVTGAGVLYLDNESVTNNGIVISGSGITGTNLANPLEIVNVGGSHFSGFSGSSTGSVSISAPIGANVTNIIQGSLTSPLILSDPAHNINFAGEIDVEGGTLKGGVANVFGGASSAVPVVMSGGTLDLGGFSQAIGSLTGTGLVTSSSGGAVNFTVGGDGTSPAAYSGVIQDGVGPVSLLKVGAGTLELSGTNLYTGGTYINLGHLQVDSSGALGTGLVNNNIGGFLDLGTTALTGIGVYTQAAGSTLNLTANSASTYGKITPASGVLSGTSTVNVNVAGYVPNGALLTVIDGGDVSGTPAVTTSLSSRVSFSGAISSDSNYVLTSDHSTNGFASLADNANAHTVGAVLDNVTNPTSDMTNVLNTLEFLPAAKVTSALNTLTPIVDAGVLQTSYASLSNFVASTIQRAQNVLNLASSGKSNSTGLSAGDKADLNGLWAKEYGGYLDQSSNQSIAGYTAWNTGTAVGVDHLFNDSLTVGLSGGYSYGSVSSSVNSGNTDINSAEATLYAGYQDASQPYFIDAAASNAWNWYDARRDISVDTFDYQASSSYRGEQYGTYLDGGYKIKVTNNLDVAPIASLQWDHLNLGSYTERNAGPLNLRVDRQSYDLLESGLGVSLTMPQTKVFGTMSPEVHVKWLHDFINDSMTTTSSFTGGGASFVTNGAKPAKDGADVGGKLSFDLKKDLSIVAEVDAQMRDNFYSIYGSAELRYQF